MPLSTQRSLVGQWSKLRNVSLFLDATATPFGHHLFRIYSSREGPLLAMPKQESQVSQDLLQIGLFPLIVDAICGLHGKLAGKKSTDSKDYRNETSTGQPLLLVLPLIFPSPGPRPGVHLHKTLESRWQDLAGYPPCQRQESPPLVLAPRTQAQAAAAGAVQGRSCMLLEVLPKSFMKMPGRWRSCL